MHTVYYKSEPTNVHSEIVSLAYFAQFTICSRVGGDVVPLTIPSEIIQFPLTPHMFLIWLVDANIDWLAKVRATAWDVFNFHS